MHAAQEEMRILLCIYPLAPQGPTIEDTGALQGSVPTIWVLDSCPHTLSYCAQRSPRKELQLPHPSPKIRGSLIPTPGPLHVGRWVLLPPDGGPNLRRVLGQYLAGIFKTDCNWFLTGALSLVDRASGVLNIALLSIRRSNPSRPVLHFMQTGFNKPSESSFAKQCQNLMLYPRLTLANQLDSIPAKKRGPEDIVGLGV